RLSHWTIAVLFAICWWSAEADHMAWHLIAGYGVLGTVCFRLVWGFYGGQTARFNQFVRGPAATVRYARKLLSRPFARDPAPVGHNPLGAWSVVCLLASLISQTVIGLFAVDVDGFESGPLSDHVSFEAGRRFAHWHADIFHLMLVLIGIHLAAIAYYRIVRKQRLVAAMLHGRQSVSASAAAPFFVSPWRAALIATGIFVVVLILLKL
ncbi:MAG: cytochrome b/b6 domain-containing protein, partial [Gammaproteobacteria bacterium]|nr:cytochrome b/b6 domain-containing protein [Gammaproteobacteria bacterium]